MRIEVSGGGCSGAGSGSALRWVTPGPTALFLGVALLAAIAFSFAAAPASAVYLHENEPSRTLGPDGTEAIGPENNFGFHSTNDMAIDQKRHRLYLLHYRNTPGAQRGIYGYDISNPAAPTPLGGKFPLPVSGGEESEIAVDDEEGFIYYLEQRPHEINREDGGNLYSWDEEGNARPGFPAVVDKWGPMAVDPLGYIWIWKAQSTSSENTLAVHKYSPVDGSFLSEIEGDLPEDPYKFGQDIYFNPYNEDLWLLHRRNVARYHADSDYSTHDPQFEFNSETYGLFGDANNGVFYVLANGTEIQTMYQDNVSGESGGPVEPSFGLGGVFSGPDQVPARRIGAVAVDESTGDIYTLESGGFEQPGLGGNIEVFVGQGAADASTQVPADVGKSDATLAATVGPGEGPPVTNCYFQYVTDRSFHDVGIVSVDGATGGHFNLGNGAIPYNATAAEVEEHLSQRYDFAAEEYFTPSVTGPAGGPWRLEFEKSHPFSMSSYLNLAANELQPRSARIGFEPDATPVPCEPEASSGSPFTNPTEVEASVPGLEPETGYHYRVVAESSSGKVWGPLKTFATTPGRVVTGSATAVQKTGATLNGTVDPEGLPTTFYFQYGRTDSYGSTTPSPPGQDLGTTVAGDQPATQSVSGLEPGTSYHYRIVAVNANGTSNGVDRTFTTAPAVVGVETLSADEVHRGDARLHGKLDPDGAETHYYFEWGTSRRYGHTSDAPPGTNLADTSPGSQSVSFTAAGLQAGRTYHYRIVADNSSGTTYGDDQTFLTPIAVKSVTTDPATDINTTEATLHGKLDPDGLQTTYYFEYGKTSTLGFAAPAPPGEPVGTSAPGVTSVSFVLAGLQPGTTYHYRLVGANETGSSPGQLQAFTTPQGPAIEAATSADVTASSAELRARVNPHGFATTYRFEYGLTIGYGSVAPVPDGELEALTSGQDVSVTLEGLEDATYHFRVVAESEWGRVETEDQTFDFAPPRCPNSTVRQQTSSNYLPDCRAYELVTPARTGGAFMALNGPTSPTAANHFAFSAGLNTIPGTDPINGGWRNFFPLLDPYVATRTQTGWVTHYIGLKGNEAATQRGVTPQEYNEVKEGNEGIPGNQQLDKFLTWDYSPQTEDYAPYMWGAQENFLGRLPSNAYEVPGATTLTPEAGGFIGDYRPSSDFSHYAFSSERIAFTPDGLTQPPGSAYDDNLETGTVEKISVDENGEDLKVDPFAKGVYNSADYIRIPAVSTDGSHILMSTKGAPETTSESSTAFVHLYMHVHGNGTYDVSKDYNGVDRGVKYVGMTSDGSEVFFTSPLQMTSDDHDQSIDLFRWDEESNSLTRLSAGDSGTGDGDSCSGSWTSKCNIEVVPVNPYCLLADFGDQLACKDSPLATDSGEVYFFSPEQLEQGAKGVAGGKNLYVWRDGGPKFVATLDGNQEIERFNVTPSGNWAAFITKSQLTAYDNDEFAEMYRYDVGTRQLICASCRPGGEPPTSDVKGSANGVFLTEGGGTFFSTRDSLVDRDSDGLSSVYEYTGGRAQLISDGAEAIEGDEAQPIGLVGVTYDGENAYFTTYKTLVPQDENGAQYKVYDARVGGGFAVEKPPAPCAAADECHGEGNASPQPLHFGSAAELGDRGNVHQKKRHRGKRHRRAHRHKHRKKSGPKTRHHNTKGATR